MGKKEEYKEKNLRFLEEVATGEGVVKLPCGVLYKEIEKGTGVVFTGTDGCRLCPLPWNAGQRTRV